MAKISDMDQSAPSPSILEQSMETAISHALWRFACLREIMEALSDGDDKNMVHAHWLQWFAECIEAEADKLDISRFPGVTA